MHALTIKKKLRKSIRVWAVVSPPEEMPVELLSSTSWASPHETIPPLPSPTHDLSDPETMSLLEITRENLKSNREMVTRLNVLENGGALSQPGST